MVARLGRDLGRSSGRCPRIRIEVKNVRWSVADGAEAVLIRRNASRSEVFGTVPGSPETRRVAAVRTGYIATSEIGAPNQLFGGKVRIRKRLKTRFRMIKPRELESGKGRDIWDTIMAAAEKASGCSFLPEHISSGKENVQRRTSVSPRPITRGYV